MNGGTYTDFRMTEPQIEEIEGVMFIFDASKPDKKYRVVELLNFRGEPVTELDDAAGGVFEIPTGFMVFYT